MALQLKVSSKLGDDAEYWKVISLRVSKDYMAMTVGGFRDIDHSKETDSKPIATFEHSLRLKDAHLKGHFLSGEVRLLDIAYTAIKQTLKFKKAVKC